MNKDCRYKKADLHCYIYNEMTRDKESVFQYHLMHCKMCRNRVKRLRSLNNIKDSNNRKSFFFKVSSSVAAVIIVLLISAYFIIDSRNPKIHLPKSTPEYHLIDSINQDSLEIFIHDTIAD